MSRIDPPAARLRPADFVQTLVLGTQYSDMDVLGHVNNVAVCRFYESARVQLHMAIYGMDHYQPGHPHRLLLADMRVGYLAEVHFPETILIGSGISRIGNSSYDITQVMFRGEACLGFCLCTLVSTRNGKAESIVGAERERFERLRVVVPE